MAARSELQRRAPQRQRVEAVVGVESLVLIGEQQFQVRRIDAGLGVDRQPPAPIRHGIGTQQLSIAVDDGGGDLTRLVEREGTERVDPADETDDGEDEGEREG
ncbi:two-component sensor histidine kinase [Bradyrhizobium liaoningense]